MKGGGGGGGKSAKDIDLRDKQFHMAVQRQRLLTLVYGEMETIRMVRALSYSSSRSLSPPIALSSCPTAS
jgi:hypothetical protein